MGAFELSLSDLQPSQLYISEAKLAEVERRIDADRRAGIEPLPVKEMGGRIVLTDGHTRAVAFLRRGLLLAKVIWDTDELDWEAYEICVGWCREEGISTVADLACRIVTPAQYEALWYGRCRALHERLAAEGQGDEARRARCRPAKRPHAACYRRKAALLKR